jgi:hypothetical protein
MITAIINDEPQHSSLKNLFEKNLGMQPAPAGLEPKVVHWRMSLAFVRQIEGELCYTTFLTKVELENDNAVNNGN